MIATTDRRALIVADAVAKWQFAEALQDSAVVAFAAAMRVSENVAMDTLNSPELTEGLIEELGVMPMAYQLGSGRESRCEYPPELEELSHLAARIDFIGRLALVGLGVLVVALALAWVTL